jgi:hypothetical protein
LSRPIIARAPQIFTPVATESQFGAASNDFCNKIGHEQTSEVVGLVEATNNKSERTLRPSVIFRRVTNGFRSEWGANVYAALCSVVATGHFAGRTALAAIRDALAASAPERTAA